MRYSLSSGSRPLQMLMCYIDLGEGAFDIVAANGVHPMLD
jgi:hypothetical protein